MEKKGKTGGITPCRPFREKEGNLFLYYSKARDGAISNTGLQRSRHRLADKTMMNGFIAV